MGEFELLTWTVYETHNAPLWGVNKPCTQSYVAQITGHDGFYTARELLSAGNTNDLYEQTSFTYSGYSSVVFHNEFSRTDGAVLTCGNNVPWVYSVAQTVSSQISVSVSAPIAGGQWALATGTLGITITSGGGSGVAFTYTVPPNYGTFYFMNLNGGPYGQVNGALAWLRAACLQGCVQSGTQISVPGGTVAVDNLSVGDEVLGYNVSTHTMVPETVTQNSFAMVSSVLSINHGLLYTTLTDQPLYVRNGSWEGWVRDPQMLRPGERLFFPLTGAWVKVTSLEVLQGNFKVYDLRVSSPYDFVANGLLALDKV